MGKVDLFLGGPLGLWVLDNVGPEDIGRVYTKDGDIFRHALRLDAAVGDFINDTHGVMAPVGLSVHWPEILPTKFISKYDRIYNIHPGLLPWGRCYYPVFWALWADEPAGCTLHEIDAEIDTGPIVAQRAVPKYAWDTGGTLHQRVSDAEKGLFLEYWPRIVSGDLPEAVPQVGEGSFHLKREFFDLKHGASCSNGSTSDIYRLIRCLSHPDYSGMRICYGGKRYEISARPVQ